MNTTAKMNAIGEALGTSQHVSDGDRVWYNRKMDEWQDEQEHKSRHSSLAPVTVEAYDEPKDPIFFPFFHPKCRRTRMEEIARLEAEVKASPNSPHNEARREQISTLHKL